jgi:hypothetical protein
MPLQGLVCLVHVADDDCHMLEPQVVAAGGNRDGTTVRRCDVLRKFDDLVAEAHLHDPHPRAEDTLEVIVRGARDLEVRHLLERQDVGIEAHRPIHVGNGEFDHRHPLHRDDP